MLDRVGLCLVELDVSCRLSHLASSHTQVCQWRSTPKYVGVLILRGAPRGNDATRVGARHGAKSVVVHILHGP